MVLFKAWRNTQPIGPDDIFYQDVQAATETVNRIEYLENIVRGKRALHFGFVDAPLSVERLRDGSLLHIRLKRASAFIHGVDLDPDAIEAYQRETGDHEVSQLDLLKDEPDLEPYRCGFDLVLVPEVLEHLINPGLALANLRRLCLLNTDNGRECRLVATVPDALALSGAIYALSGIGSVHPDHHFYFSPYTLRKILTDCGFEVDELYVYGRRSVPGVAKNGVIAVARALA